MFDRLSRTEFYLAHRESPVILIVEDEFLVALDMETILGEAGFDVLGPAGSVSEALRLLAVRQPDAALMRQLGQGRGRDLGGEALDAIIGGVDLKHKAGRRPDGGGIILEMGPVGGADFDEARAGAGHDLGGDR